MKTAIDKFIREKENQRVADKVTPKQRKELKKFKKKAMRHICKHK